METASPSFFLVAAAQVGGQRLTQRLVNAAIAAFLTHHFAIDGESLLDDDAFIELGQRLASGRLSQTARQIPVVLQSCDCRSQRSGLARGDEQAVDAIGNHLAASGHVCSDERPGAGGRLDQTFRQTLAIARQYHDIGARQ